MTTQPAPPNRSPIRAGFTLIELLVVISIIAILVSVTIPIYKMVSDSTNSARSLANLGSIGTLFTLYAAANDNFLPQAQSDQEYDWTGIELDIDVAELEGLPNWTLALIHTAALDDSDVTERVFNCPGIKWRDQSGERYPADDILLAYGATECLYGFDEAGELTPQRTRSLASIESRPNTILLIEAKQEGSNPFCFSEVTWSEASTDFSRPKPANSEIVDFRFKKAANCLMSDGSARSFRHKDRADLMKPHWTGYDYESIR